MRPPLGEFYNPDSRGSASDEYQAAIRRRFLEIAQELEPELLPSLAENVLPHFREVADAHDLYQLRHHAPPSLEQALGEWLQRWSLRTAWARWHALWTLQEWQAGRSPPGQGWGGRPPWSTWETIRYDETVVPPVRLPQWNPQLETWKEYNARARQTYTTHLSQYRERLEGLAVERGLVRVPQPREIERDLRWLAMRQVQRLTWSEIERRSRVHVSERTIRTAVPEVAQLLGLPLRASRPGRPRRR